MGTYRYIWIRPSRGMKVCCWSSLGGCLLFSAIGSAITGLYDPRIISELGCVSTADHISSVLLGVSGMFAALFLFFLPMCIDFQLAALFMWFGSLYVLLIFGLLVIPSNAQGKVHTAGKAQALLAITVGDAARLQSLLNSDPSPLNADYYNQNSLLHIAAVRGNAEVIRVLLVNGIDPSTKNNEGDTPRSLAERFMPDNARLFVP